MLPFVSFIQLCERVSSRVSTVFLFDPLQRHKNTLRSDALFWERGALLGEHGALLWELVLYFESCGSGF